MIIMRANPKPVIQNYPQNNKIAFKAKPPLGFDIFTSAAINKPKSLKGTLNVIFSVLTSFLKGGKPPINGTTVTVKGPKILA